KKIVDINELLFREKFSDYEEVRLYRKGRYFFLERIHSKISMSRDKFDDPEEAYYYYNMLVEKKSTHY
ncbi:MAG: hypothetical protein NZ533_12535, partial [Casimicrobiaceae bacterium]|nr:hypothetical protein [Casimicrobiaceae bacterium]